MEANFEHFSTQNKRKIVVATVENLSPHIFNKVTFLFTKPLSEFNFNTK